jgi:hypothetical protein
MVQVFFRSHSYGGFQVRVQAGDYYTVVVDGEHHLELDAAILLDLLAARIRDARIVGAIAEQLGSSGFRERLGYVPVPGKPPVRMLSEKERKRQARLSRRQKGASP